jgi:acetylornithine deacetylase/succinyl-diaminopimelate desuccinylase family protein
MSRQEQELTSLLQQLIRIPSPNPPGDTRAMAEFCAAFLDNAGFETRLVAPDGRAWSVVGRAGGSDGPTVVYHAHIDTVPLGRNAQWRHDPFAGVVEDNRMYGLGSIDDKAPLAAMLQVAANVGERREQMRGSLVIACAADEEVGGQLGTQWLVAQGHIPTCDFAVVGEQTHNRVATAHKGVVRATFHVGGRAAHATTPWRGRNAINGMAHLILDLERYQREVLDARPHSLLGAASVNAGLIEGGSGVNVVADACTLFVDRRIVPGEDPEAVKAELQALVAARQAADPDRAYSVGDFLVSDWFQSDADAPHARRFLAIAAAETGAPAEPVGYLPGSDAKHLTGAARKGIVVFGPGTYQVAHSVDEYTDLAELQITHRILQRFVDETLFG